VGGTVHSEAFPALWSATSQREMVFDVNTKLTITASRIFVLMALILTTANLRAQDGRKVIANPVPVYPEVAKRLSLTGTVKVQVVIATDGKIKETKVVGGHPLLVSSVEETLKNWKYAPASTETTATLEFRFHP
jgi:TonB family protein